MIKLKPSYQTSDGKCYASYEEAQSAEIRSIFAKSNPDAHAPWGISEIVTRILENAAEIREILAPQIGRPLGSKNGVSRSRKKAAPQLPLDDVAPGLTAKE